ncbi:MAG: hypothetical protein WC570_01050 [Patescibacteria group bacterium]
MTKTTIDDLSKIMSDEVSLLDERLTKLEERMLVMEMNMRDLGHSNEATQYFLRTVTSDVVAIKQYQNISNRY